MMMTQLHPTEPVATFKLSVPAEQAQRFFDAVAWQLPARPLAPPTLATLFREGEYLAMQTLKTSIEQVLHGEQRYRFIKDLYADVAYEGETFINSHYERASKSGGPTMHFYVLQTNIKDAAGETCAECFSTIIVRK